MSQIHRFVYRMNINSHNVVCSTTNVRLRFSQYARVHVTQQLRGY